MKKKIFEPEEILSYFLNDLNHAIEVNHLYLVILILSLYSEHIVDEVIKLNFGHNLENRRELGQDLKLKFLHGTKIIADSEYNVLDKLRDVRNDISHNIRIDLDGLDKKMQKVEINYMSEVTKQKIDSWPIRIKFLNGCIAKIFFLLKKVYNIPKKFSIGTKNGKYVPFVNGKIISEEDFLKMSDKEIKDLEKEINQE